MIKRGAVPSDGFTIISNAWLRDPNISAKAKGILAYVLSHDAGYELTLGQMQREMSDGEAALRSGIEELEQAGYLAKERQRDETGRLGAYHWTIGSFPSSEPDVVIQPGSPSLDNHATKKTTPQKTTKSPETSSRGTRLPEDWTPSEELIEWARSNAPGVGWKHHERFMDYWRGIPGAKGRKLDWDATWRNWMRRESDNLGVRPTSGAPAGQYKTAAEKKTEAAQKAKLRAQLTDKLIEQGVPAKEAWDRAGAEIEKGLATSSPMDYIGSKTIDGTGTWEVTA